MERDIQIESAGMPTGEKTCEELFLDFDRHCRTAHKKIFEVRAGPGSVLVPLDAPSRRDTQMVSGGEATV